MTCLKRLKKELFDFKNSPPPQCSGGPIDGNLQKWEIIMEGPIDSPYSAGKFRLSLDFPDEDPF